MEIERKFKIKELPKDLESRKSYEIEQAYISKEPTIRIRKRDDSYILTIKVKTRKEEVGSVLVNQESEFFITKEEYESLLEKIEGNIIKKRRYLIPLEDGKLAELDVFGGHLSGLVFVEVEFSGIAEAEDFERPFWFGEDVSEDRRYRNTELSKLKEFRAEDFY